MEIYVYEAIVISYTTNYKEKTMNDRKTPEKKYPEVYEKLIPVAIGIMVVIVIGVLILTLGIAFGFIQGT